MQNKKEKLKDTNLYIESDLTKQESQIAKTLRDIAKAERAQGKTIK